MGDSGITPAICWLLKIRDGTVWLRERQRKFVSLDESSKSRITREEQGAV